MGRLKIFPTIEPWQREFGEELTGILGDAAPDIIKRVFEREDMGDILSDFKEHFAEPMMSMWREMVEPGVKEGFNLPGAFYSRDRFKGVQRAGEEFLTTRVQPALFSTLDSARQRELQRQSIIANVLTGSQSLATSPTQTGTMTSAKSSGTGSLLGMGAAVGLGLLTGGAGLGLAPGLGGVMGSGGLGMSFMETAAFGGMVGGAFN